MCKLELVRASWNLGCNLCSTIIKRGETFIELEFQEEERSLRLYFHKDCLARKIRELDSSSLAARQAAEKGEKSEKTL